jgi:hypothetical protein
MPGDEMFYGPGVVGYELVADRRDPEVWITFIDYR